LPASRIARTLDRNLRPVNTPAWVNVEADPFNVLLQGDPRPNPLVPPFEQSGSDVIVDCGP
jgi:hypothetical protein